MKSKLETILTGVATAVLLGILASAVQTYVEVKMLRKDVNELRYDLDSLYGDTSDQVERLHKLHKEEK